MSEIYDNWERLVQATLRREDLRCSAERTPSDISSASSSPSSFDFAGIGSHGKLKVVIFKISLSKSSFNAMRFLINVMKPLLPRELAIRPEPKILEDKNRAKAMTVVKGMPGVLSRALAWQNENELVVPGDGFDPMVLTRLLRKNVGHAEIWSVDTKY